MKVSTLKKKLLRYCNPAGPPLGNEHSEPMEYAQFKLKQVQVVARHGDRSSVATNFANMVNFNCDLSSQNFQHARKLEMLQKMERFLKVVHVKGREEIVRDFMLTGTKICRPGRLKGIGNKMFYCSFKKKHVFEYNTEHNSIISDSNLKNFGDRYYKIRHIEKHFYHSLCMQNVVEFEFGYQ